MRAPRPARGWSVLSGLLVFIALLYWFGGLVPFFYLPPEFFLCGNLVTRSVSLGGCAGRGGGCGVWCRGGGCWGLWRGCWAGWCGVPWGGGAGGCGGGGWWGSVRAVGGGCWEPRRAKSSWCIRPLCSKLLRVHLEQVKRRSR